MQPEVSVVLCVRNAGAVLDEQLTALSEQRFDGPWELVVVNNGSTDDTMDRVQRFVQRFPMLTVVDAHERAGLSYARNRGAEGAHADVVVFCDADDVVSPTWLAGLAAAVAPGRIAGGALDYRPLNDDVVLGWRELPTVLDELPVRFDEAFFVSGANFGLTRADLADLGGFDETFTQSSDELDLCYRARARGMHIVFADDAVVAYRFRDSVRDMCRQQKGYGRSSVLLYRKHRDLITRPTARAALAPYWHLLTHCHQLVRGRQLRGRWLCWASYRWGRVTGSIKARVLFL